MPDDPRGTGNRAVHARSLGLPPNKAWYVPPPLFDPLYPMSNYEEGIAAIDAVPLEPADPPPARPPISDGPPVMHLDVPDEMESFDDPRGTARPGVAETQPGAVQNIVPLPAEAPPPSSPEDTNAWMYDLNRGLMAHGVRPLQDPARAPTEYEIRDRVKGEYLPIYDPDTGQVSGYHRERDGVRIFRDREGRITRMSEVPLQPPDIEPEDLNPGKLASGTVAKLGGAVFIRSGRWLARGTGNRIAAPVAATARGLSQKQIAKYQVDRVRAGEHEIDPSRGILPWIRHNWGGAIRKEADMGGLQSAHIVPQDVGAMIPGYKGRNALTVLLPPQVHSAFDNNWKRVWQAKKASGDTIYVRDVEDMVAKAIRDIRDDVLPPASKEAMRRRLKLELYGGAKVNGLGLKRGDVLHPSPAPTP